MSSALTRPIKYRKHEFASRLRNYQMSTTHEAYVTGMQPPIALAIADVVGYEWHAGIYWITFQNNGRILTVPVENVRLLSPAF